MLAKIDDFHVQRTLNCENDINNVTDDLSSSLTAVSITDFERKFQDNIVAFSHLVLIQPDRSPFSVEFLLNMLMMGHDANGDEQLSANETPVLKELAVIDNTALSVINNSTVSSPRRFFRIGIAPVSIIDLDNKMTTLNQKKTIFRRFLGPT